MVAQPLHVSPFMVRSPRLDPGSPLSPHCASKQQSYRSNLPCSHQPLVCLQYSQWAPGMPAGRNSSLQVQREMEGVLHQHSNCIKAVQHRKAKWYCTKAGVMSARLLFLGHSLGLQDMKSDWRITVRPPSSPSTWPSAWSTRSWALFCGQPLPQELLGPSPGSKPSRT